MDHAPSSTDVGTSSTPSFALPAALTMESVEAALTTLRTLPLEKSDIFMLNAASNELITTPGIQLVLSAAKTVEAGGGLFLIVQPQAAFIQAFSDLGLGGWLKQREASHG